MGRQMLNVLAFAVLIFLGTAFKFQGLISSENIQTAANSTTKILFPLPKSLSTNSSSPPLHISPCEINYKIIATPSTNIQRIINQYLIDIYSCAEIKPGNITLLVTIKDPTIMTSTKTSEQKFQLSLGEGTQWSLIADTHVGFLRGFQTYSQLFEENPDNDKSYIIRGRPIQITDQPDYIWRGVMLDTSRHFYPLNSILHLIDGLLYNKMSIFHWHIIDEDSFPMEVPDRMDLSDAGKVGGSYSREDLLTVINYAKVRGVRVIPEFDTPAHTESWGRSQALKDIVVKCNDEYEGQFDPTLNLTYEVVKDVMQYVNNTFTDQYAHFGGDEVQEDCWGKKPSIYEWMRTHNILTYRQLQIYYRQQEKKLWRDSISSSKKAIYWANEDIDLPVEDDDVIHWWGITKNVDHLAGRPNEIILSNYDITYLDIGFGGRYGKGYGNYITWRQFYSFNPKIANVNVIGGESCMWSETADASSMDQKIWIRSSALAERLWNSNIDISKQLLNISERLISQARRMKKRGFKVSPVTVGLCQKDPSICFS